MRETLSGVRAWLWIGLLLLSLRSFADVPPCPAGYTFGFFNGVGNTELDAQDGLSALRDAFHEANGSQSDIYDHEDVAFQYFYNHTGSSVGKSILQDVAEVFIQRAHALDDSGSLEAKYFYLVWEPVNGNGPGFGNTAAPMNDSLADFLSNFSNATITAAAAWLSTKLSSPPTEGDYAQHRAALDVATAAGRKMLLVAHSQGNLFVNVAYDYIQPIASSARVKVVHIAPASTILNGPWALANIDLIINALRLDGGLGSVADNNLQMTPSTSDVTGHTLVGTYLDGTRPGRGAVQTMMMNGMSALDASPQCRMTMSPPAYVAKTDEKVILTGQLPDLPSDPNVFIVTYTWTISGNAGGYFVDPNTGAHVAKVEAPGLIPNPSLTYNAPPADPGPDAQDTVTIVANLTNIDDTSISTKEYATASATINYGNGCYDLAFFRNPGASTSVTYQIGDGTNSSLAQGTRTDDYVARGRVTFNGISALEQDQTVTTTYPNSPADNSTSQSLLFDDLSAGGVVTWYGSTIIVGPSTFAAVYAPPALDRRATLTVGGTATLALTGTAVSSSPSGSQTKSFDASEVWTFANREIVSVPAGQYPTCKYQYSIVGTPGLTTDWLLDGNGVLLQRVVTDSTGAVVSFEKATSVTINGVPR